MIAALATPALACGGTLDNGDAGSDAGSDTSIDTGMPGCNAQVLDPGSGPCSNKTVQLSGDISKCALDGDAGYVPSSSCQAICGGTQWGFCTFDTSNDVLTCEGMCTGRLPANLLNAPTEETHGVGDYLARAAYLEAAAVSAFTILAAELRAHGAPRSLTRSAHRARADEVRHAREVGGLARAFGGAPEKPEVGPARVRPIVEIAIENAVEGCVRETFGALVAQWQGEHARDFRVRAIMKRIARDEVRHAALGWRVFDWAMARISLEERARVEAAMLRAIDELEASARVEPDRALARTLGLPNAAQASALVAAMRGEVWTARAA
jgi:hypothetical protein